MPPDSTAAITVNCPAASLSCSPPPATVADGRTEADELHAVTTRAGTGDDPLDHLAAGAMAFRSPNRTLVAHGVARRVELGRTGGWANDVAAISEALAAIDREGRDGEPASGPVAFCALPFDRRRTAAVTIPRLVRGRDVHGSSWVTTISPANPAAGTTPSPPFPSGRSTNHLATDPTGSELGGDTAAISGPPPELRLRASIGDAEWMAKVDELTRHMAAGQLEKAVLFRELRLTSEAPLDPIALYRRLLPTAPAGYVFCLDGFVGASPELLVSRIDDTVRAEPMAGTLPRSGDPQTDLRRAGELLRSEKLRHEHAVTIERAHDALLGWCSYLDAQPEPQVVEAGAVLHLATLVEGRLSHPAPTVLDLVAALHPTPAVGGWPIAEALELIDELECLDRDRVGGAVGWVDADGNGEFAVAIRSALLDGTTARLLAGVGIVADSDPQAELEETRAKFAAVLPHLIRP
ncbi:MAG: isochorismate synthase [Candidatus Microthrix parvicella]